MSILNIYVYLTIVVTLKLSATNANDSEEVPLKIIWNVQTQGKWGCEREFGIPIDVRQYGMLENAAPGSDGWLGEIISIVYQDIGQWPVIHKGEPINGGLPQLGNLQTHLKKVEEDITRKIPNANFSGLGVLDFEEWWAIWDMNFISGPMGIYRTESMDLVAQEQPGLTDAEIEKIAMDEYNRAARAFIEGTLLLAKRLRPHAKWGYYIYPKCHNRKWDEQCHPNSEGYVKQMEWLAQGSDVLYPSAYFYEYVDKDRRPALVDGAVHMSRVWLNITGEPHKPIYFYTTTTLNNHPSPMPYYNDFDLVSSLGIAADTGVNGIIIWGNNYRKRPESQCQREKEYLETKLGKYVQRLLDFFHKCSRDICSSSGRCVKNKIEVDSTKINDDLDKDHVYSLEYAQQSYYCRCYKGRTGEDCSDKK